MDATTLAVLVEQEVGDTMQAGGLPLHPLLVHAVVVLVPLTAVALLLGAFWPAARQRLGIVTTLSAAAVVVLVPITVAAGLSLKQAVGPLPAVLRHESLGRMLLPWVIALFLVAVAQWGWFRFGLPSTNPGSNSAAPGMRRLAPVTARVVTIALAVACVAVSVGAVMMVVLIGDSGSRAVWGGLLG